MSDILISYDENREIYSSYALALKSLLNTLIRSEGIAVHSLDSRVKARKSLENKIVKKGKYVSINDVTDVVGIRIITHYADDVDKIATLVESEFFIDKENSIDKRVSIEPDKFGYLSLHYIITLNNTRSNLREYEAYKDIKAEIQIRSILQHAWAEIEHDIGYKSATGLPNNIRRSFSRLAGLLELADEEFIKIKGKINERQKEVARELEQGSGDSYLDIVALNEYIRKSKILNDIAKEISEKHGLITEGRSKLENLELILNGLYLAGITTIAELNSQLLKLKDYVIERPSWFSEAFQEYYKTRTLGKSSLLAFLSQIIVALANSPNLEKAYSETASSTMKAENVGPFFSELRENLMRMQ
ncbi:GTP pyrophosphokinase family protein [Cronobacter turicensis]